jgi:hypothetical protein
MEDTIEFTREELLAAVADRIALKRNANGGDDGADDHEFVTDFYKTCMERARERGKSIFCVMPEVVREDPKLGQRFLAYVFEDVPGRK